MEPSLPPSDIFPAYLFVMLWGLGDEDVGSLWRHTEGARRGSKGRSIFLLFPPCIQMSNYQDPAPTLTRTHQGIYSYTHYILLLLDSPSVRRLTLGMAMHHILPMQIDAHIRMYIGKYSRIFANIRALSAWPSLTHTHLMCDRVKRT